MSETEQDGSHAYSAGPYGRDPYGNPQVDESARESRDESVSDDPLPPEPEPEPKPGLLDRFLRWLDDAIRKR